MTLINYSEFNTLTDCEQKWWYLFGEQLEEEGAKKGLHLGTLCHLWHGSWLVGNGATLPEVWTDDINTGGKPGEVRTLSLSDFDPELVERARWLAQRFAAHYGEQPPSSWNVISAEEWLKREFAWGTLVGRTDGFVEIDGQLWLIEAKSYGSRPGPLAYAQVSPQPGCYSLLAEAHYGRIPFGILYQGMYTYRWKQQTQTLAEIEEHLLRKPENQVCSKKDLRSAAKAIQPRMLRPERDPSESFDQLEVEMGADHLNTAERYLAAAVRRRATLLDDQDEVLPSVGAHCRNCGFRPRCWHELGGVEEFEIEIEDDDAEPV